MQYENMFNPFWWTLPIGIIVGFFLNKKYRPLFGNEGDLTVRTGYVPSEDMARLTRALDIVEEKIVEYHITPQSHSPRLEAFLVRTKNELRLQIRVLHLRSRYADLKQVRDETNKSSRLTG